MRFKLVICAMLCASLTGSGGCAPLAQQAAKRSPLLESGSQKPTVPRESRLQTAKVTVANRPTLSQDVIQPETIPAPAKETPPRPLALDPPEPETRRERFPMPTPKENDGLRPIGALTVGIAPPKPKEGGGAGEFPENLAQRKFGDLEPILVEMQPFEPWNAYGQLVLSADFCHQPLYFEDINLERYGRSHGILQPIISAARFYGSVPALPYKMVVEPPRVCLKDNSRWPAGGLAPHQRNLPPFDVKASVVEAAVIVGLILLIP